MNNIEVYICRNLQMLFSAVPKQFGKHLRRCLLWYATASDTALVKVMITLISFPNSARRKVQVMANAR